MAKPEAVHASGRVRNFESMWTRKYGFPVRTTPPPPKEKKKRTKKKNKKELKKQTTTTKQPKNKQTKWCGNIFYWLNYVGGDVVRWF